MAVMMRLLLLDTCIVYDWLMGELNEAQLIKQIQSEGALVSPVSVWEMAIKNGIGKMPLPTLNVAEDIEAQGFQWLNITALPCPSPVQIGGVS